MNNENALSHSPSEELILLKKKMELQSQKSISHDQKIKDLQARIEAAKKRTQQKRQTLVQTQQRIVQEKQKSVQVEGNPGSQQSSSSGLQSKYSSAIIDQLREHFKALRQQMMSEADDDEDDDDYYDEVDVDNMTYEQLLELGEKIGKVSKGLDMKKMDSLQVKKYKNPNPNEPFDCAICRDQLEDGADCIELQCQHVFHDECIKGWLNVEKHCPNCKRQIKNGGESQN